MDLYRIASVGGALNQTGWNSLSDQDIDTIGSEAGQSWDESGGSNEFGLGEIFLDGSSTLAPGGSYDLGDAFDPSVFGSGNAGDLEFFIVDPLNERLPGRVEYVTGPGVLPGDLNGDNLVNFGDLSPFVLALTDVPAYDAMFPDLAATRVDRCDTSGDSMCNFGDLSPFVAILTGGSSRASAVPEPAAMWGVMTLAFASSLCRRWTGRGKIA
jgi:hypothetical protein